MYYADGGIAESIGPAGKAYYDTYIAEHPVEAWVPEIPPEYVVPAESLNLDDIWDSNNTWDPNNDDIWN